MSKSILKVIGVVSLLKTSTAEENFVSQTDDRVIGSAAAVGLAAIGLAGAATGAAISSGDASDKVTIFTCVVGEYSVSGRFGEVTFVEGDHIEVVGFFNSNNISALAITRPADKTIWMFPHCGRGTKAYRNYCWRWIPTISVVLPMVFMTAMTVISGSQGLDVWFFASIGITGMLACAMLLLLLARKFYAFAKLSDQIFTTLGFKHAESIDLPQILSNRQKEQPDIKKTMFHPWKRWVYLY